MAHTGLEDIPPDHLALMIATYRDIGEWEEYAQGHIERIKRNLLSLALGAAVAFVYITIWQKLHGPMKFAPEGYEQFNTLLGMGIFTGSSSLLVAIIRGYLNPEPGTTRVRYYSSGCFVTLIEIWLILFAPIIILVLAWGLGYLIHLLFDWFPEYIFCQAVMIWPAIQLLIIVGSLIAWFVCKKVANKKAVELVSRIPTEEIMLYQNVISEQVE